MRGFPSPNHLQFHHKHLLLGQLVHNNLVFRFQKSVRATTTEAQFGLSVSCVWK